MKIFRDRESELRPADPGSFLGPAATKLLASAEDGAAVHLYRVEFESGGRTNWHTHSGPQWLFVIRGRVRVQRSGEAAQDVEAGDAVLFAPGDKHWHGAAPGGRGAHLAVNVNVKTDWLEPVTEEEYNATRW
jgi:quercetin dioxygenase-like cupin family protein